MTLPDRPNKVGRATRRSACPFDAGRQFERAERAMYASGRPRHWAGHMRLTSTPESARAGEPSLLAIIETLLAMAASGWIGVHRGLDAVLDLG